MVSYWKNLGTQHSEKTPDSSEGWMRPQAPLRWDQVGHVFVLVVFLRMFFFGVGQNITIYSYVIFKQY